MMFTETAREAATKVVEAFHGGGGVALATCIEHLDAALCAPAEGSPMALGEKLATRGNASDEALNALAAVRAFYGKPAHASTEGQRKAMVQAEAVLAKYRQTATLSPTTQRDE